MPVAPPHASKGLPSPKRLRAGRRNPPKHTLLRSFRASKGTLSTFIGMGDRACTPKCVTARRRGFLRRRVTTYPATCLQDSRFRDNCKTDGVVNHMCDNGPCPIRCENRDLTRPTLSKGISTFHELVKVRIQFVMLDFQ